MISAPASSLTKDKTAHAGRAQETCAIRSQFVTGNSYFACISLVGNVPLKGLRYAKKGDYEMTALTYLLARAYRALVAARSKQAENEIRRHIQYR